MDNNKSPTTPRLDLVLAAMRCAADLGDPLLDAYRDYRNAANRFVDLANEHVGLYPVVELESCILDLQRQFPELANEDSFRTTVAELGVDPAQVGHLDAEKWLRNLTEGVLPGRAPINMAVILARVADLLEQFSRGFIDARNAWERTVARRGWNMPGDESLLYRIEDHNGLLAWLLTPHRNENHRDALSDALSLLALALDQLGMVSAASCNRCHPPDM